MKVPERNIGREPPASPPNPDSLPYGKLALVLFGVLAVFGAAVALMYLEEVLTRPSTAPAPSTLGKPELQGVNQAGFRVYIDADQMRARQQFRLSTYGWVDRDAGVAHIPIDEAMRMVATTDGGVP